MTNQQSLLLLTVAARAGPPTPNGTLINGLGHFSNGPTDAPLAIVNVKYNKRYRFRLVSISCDPNFKFSIDGHNMTIIEVDTVNVEPLTADSIQIFAGQRYSFVLNANQPINNYWIRAEPNLGNSSFTGGLNSAILRYYGAPVQYPNTTRIVNNPMLETNLHPLENPGAPGVPGVGNADVNLPMIIDLNRTSGLFTVNNASFIPPKVPVLLQIMSGAHLAQDLMPKESLYILQPNQVVELTIPGGAPGSPHVFDVVRSAGSDVYNYDNPVRRDVVSSGVKGDMTTIRFKTDNAGPWIMHCHIDWHLELGLSVVFVEDFVGIQQSSQPPAWDQLCPTFDALPAQTFP
ncbi:hypothetical protein D9613_011034 [Agrocybe pediades]|uniref:Laccase n=1 Tax=Agrocybe pediades TaxID=84607 RepID=A0A8H4QN19_9AGAR|nr:hypothetical protein D9613_011034 [Agrocybe pediades]